MEHFIIQLKKINDDIKIIEYNDEYYIDEDRIIKILEHNAVPFYYFKNIKKIDKVLYYNIEDLYNYIMNSPEDEKLSDFNCSPSKNKILWRNSHYLIDYHIPLKSTKVYSAKLAILSKIVQVTCDDFNIRGINQHTIRFDDGKYFTCDYFINLPLKPLIINLIEHSEHIKMSHLNRLENYGYSIINVFLSEWNEKKAEYINQIRKHLKMLVGLNFIKTVQRMVDKLDLNELIYKLNGNIYLSGKFLFDLHKTLKVLDVDEGTDKHNEIIGMFVENGTNCQNMFIEEKHYIFANNSVLITQSVLAEIAILSHSPYGRKYIDNTFELINYIKDNALISYTSIMDTIKEQDKEKEKLIIEIKNMYDTIHKNKHDELSKKYSILEKENHKLKVKLYMQLNNK